MPEDQGRRSERLKRQKRDQWKKRPDGARKTSPYFSKKCAPVSSVSSRAQSQYFVDSPASSFGTLARLGPLVLLEADKTNLHACANTDFSYVTHTVDVNLLVCSSCAPLLRNAKRHFDCCELFQKRFKSLLQLHQQRRRDIICPNCCGSPISSHQSTIIPCWERYGMILEEAVRHLCSNRCYYHAFAPFREWLSLQNSINEIYDQPSENLLLGWKCHLVEKQVKREKERKQKEEQDQGQEEKIQKKQQEEYGKKQEADHICNAKFNNFNCIPPKLGSTAESTSQSNFNALRVAFISPDRKLFMNKSQVMQEISLLHRRYKEKMRIDNKAYSIKHYFSNSKPTMEYRPCMISDFSLTTVAAMEHFFVAPNKAQSTDERQDTSDDNRNIGCNSIIITSNGRNSCIGHHNDSQDILKDSLRTHNSSLKCQSSCNPNLVISNGNKDKMNENFQNATNTTVQKATTHVSKIQHTNSRLGLLEELFCDDPWRLLLSTIMLNRTTRVQVDVVLFHFLKLWPSASTLVTEGTVELIREVIAPLGLGHKRAKGILRFSNEYLKLLKVKKEKCVEKYNNCNHGGGSDLVGCCIGDSDISSSGYSCVKGPSQISASLTEAEKIDADKVADKEQEICATHHHLTKDDILGLYQCGEYAYSAYKLFILRELDSADPSDPVLRSYIEYQRGALQKKRKVTQK